MPVIDLPVAILSRYLERHLSGFQGPMRVRKFSGGQSNPSFEITTAAQKYVLRKQPAGKLLPSAHALDREYRVLSALKQTSVPVPEVYHLCIDSSVIGSMFYIMQFIGGDIYWDVALPKQQPTQRNLIYQRSAQVLASIHNTNIQAVGLSDFGKTEGYYQRQLKRWTSQYRASQTAEITAMDQLIEELRASLPTDNCRVTLVHGDYRLDNMIYNPENQDIEAVLDWELSTLGHPLSDLAYQCMQLRLPPNKEPYMLSGLGGLNKWPKGIPKEDEYIADYIKARNETTEISNWYFYLAFAFFRLAAIAQGVTHRAQMGNASSKSAHKIGAMVAPITAMALDIISKKEQL